MDEEVKRMVAKLWGSVHKHLSCCTLLIYCETKKYLGNNNMNADCHNTRKASGRSSQPGQVEIL